MMRYSSLSPNSGQVFAHWNEVEDQQVANALTRLSSGTEALTRDMALRRDVLNRALAALESASEELVSLAIDEVGKIRAEAGGELRYAASFLETSLGFLENYPFVREDDYGREMRAVPRGIGLLITPYNDPIAGLTRKIGPCLAAGAAALVKPSALGMQCALTLARHFSSANLDDYIAFLPMAQPDRIKKVIVAPEIGTVSFTGSTQVGLEVATCAAAHAKAHVGEWGGTNPFVVFTDADLDRAVTDLVTRKTKSAGQACSAQNIVYAEAPIATELYERVSDAMGAVSFGASTESVAMGPVRTSISVKRLADTADLLSASGATRLCGGITDLGEGHPFLAPPTVYRVLDAGLFETHEMFGPMLGIAPFQDRAELRARLARNKQPLVLYLYSADLDMAKRYAEGLRYGSIGINTTGIQSPDAPTGGFGLAGLGREGGPWGLAEFLTTINLKEQG